MTMREWPLGWQIWAHTTGTRERSTNLEESHFINLMERRATVGARHIRSRLSIRRRPSSGPYIKTMDQAVTVTSLATMEASAFQMQLASTAQTSNSYTATVCAVTERTQQVQAKDVAPQYASLTTTSQNN